MATTGILAFAAAKIATEEEGKLPTYEKGIYIDTPTAIDVTLNYGNNPFYAGNREVNNDTDFTDGTITVGVAELGSTDKEAFENEQYILGGKLDTETDPENPELLSGGEIDSPYMGSGYIKTFKYAEKSATGYEVTWFYRSKYTPTGESLATKAGSTTFSAPSITGRLYTVPGIDPKINLRSRKRFQKMEDAVAYLKQLAAVTTAAEATSTTSGTDTTGDDNGL